MLRKVFFIFYFRPTSRKLSTLEKEHPVLFFKFFWRRYSGIPRPGSGPTDPPASRSKPDPDIYTFLQFCLSGSGRIRNFCQDTDPDTDAEIFQIGAGPDPK
jgi:hypothetical protein